MSVERLTNGIDYCQLHCDFGKEKDCIFQDKIKCYEKNMYEKLRSYEDAEEQGLLLRLPCKVGDKVYELIPRVRFTNNFRENEVVAITVYCDSVYLSLKNGFPKDIKQIGKILFLTKEEAEQALKSICKN